jgi:hypothetical protein
MSFDLDLAIEAVRAAGSTESIDDVDAGAPQATGLRVRRSLEARRRPRIWAAIAAALGISSIGGVAFAIATGRIAIGARAPATAAPAIAAPAPPPARHPKALAMTAPPVVAPIEAPPPRAAAPTPLAAPRVTHRAVIEAAYRRAHELHFRGDDPTAALAAWDDYLRADPGGRFAAEARFNRAIDLIKLGRFDDARAALAPFARGDGYRKDDAQRLLDRLDAIGAPDSTIVAAPGTTP